jgi:hypothetical protein
MATLNSRQYIRQYINIQCTTYKQIQYTIEQIESRLVCKFRLSDHSLAIETGRYKKIPQHLRTCNKCETLDDKNHFFLNYFKSD